MESTACGLANREWNSRLNRIKQNAHNGLSLINLGEEYYTKFLKISEVLIQLLLQIEDKLQNGRTSVLSDQVEHTLLEIGGTIGLTVTYTVQGNSSAITIGDFFEPHVRIGMLRTEYDYEVLEGYSFIGQGMIVLQGADSGYYSSNGLGMFETLKESIEYLKNDKYRTFMIYGKHVEAPIDLESYKGVVEQIIEKASELGYI